VAPGTQVGGLGTMNADGTINIANQSMLKTLGIQPGNRVVYDPNEPDPNKAFKLQQPTTTSVEQPSTLDEARTNLSALKYGNIIVGGLLYDLQKNPGDFGIAGSLKGIVQELTAKGLDITISPAVEAVLPKDYFNPRLPQVTQYEHVLTFIVAKQLMAQSGTSGSMQGMGEAMKTAEGMVDFTGNISTKAVESQLKTLKNNFGEWIDNTQKKLPTNAGQTAVPDSMGQSTRGKTGDMTPSEFPTMGGGSIHTPYIPEGAIIDFKATGMTAKDKADFDAAFGKGASAEVIAGPKK
jgi:hypothetical protein